MSSWKKYREEKRDAAVRGFCWCGGVTVALFVAGGLIPESVSYALAPFAAISFSGTLFFGIALFMEVICD